MRIRSHSVASGAPFMSPPLCPLAALVMLLAMAPVATSVAQTTAYAPPPSTDCKPRDWGAGELRDSVNVPPEEFRQAALVVAMIGIAVGDVEAPLRSGAKACRLQPTMFAGTPYQVFAPQDPDAGPFDYWAAPLSAQGRIYVFGRVGEAGRGRATEPAEGFARRGFVAAYENGVFSVVDIFTDRANPGLGLAIASTAERYSKRD